MGKLDKMPNEIRSAAHQLIHEISVATGPRKHRLVLTAFRNQIWEDIGYGPGPGGWKACQLEHFPKGRVLNTQEDQMDAAALYFEEEHLSQTQIATIIGVSQGTVSRRLSAYYSSRSESVAAAMHTHQPASDDETSSLSQLQVEEFDSLVRAFVQKKPTANPRSIAAWPRKRTGRRRGPTIAELLRSCEELEDVFNSGRLPDGTDEKRVIEVMQAAAIGLRALTSLLSSIVMAQDHDPLVKTVMANNTHNAQDFSMMAPLALQTVVGLSRRFS